MRALPHATRVRTARAASGHSRPPHRAPAARRQSRNASLDAHSAFARREMTDAPCALARTLERLNDSRSFIVRDDCDDADAHVEGQEHLVLLYPAVLLHRAELRR